MTDYRVDTRDLRFQLLEWLPTAELLCEERFADWEMEQMEMALDEAVRLAREVIGPTNVDGDRQGVAWDAGRVRVPESFRPAYEALCNGGWMACNRSPRWGGLGLPEVMATVVNELISGANLSLSLITILNRGTGHLVEAHGDDALRRLYCERLYSGRWAGSMCLTEPQAGSDVGACTTRAEPLGGGRYKLCGEKIFITFGEHDLTENIVHAVLARAPGAPPGSRGLSLFVVPKRRVEADGSLGEDNDVYCAGVEHKMGIHGSPTCSLLFGRHDACEGVILGEEGQGLRLMFEMMNAARLEVGVEALAVAGAAHQAALDYARERRQMRHYDRARASKEPVAIVEHPDVRRILLSADAQVQAMRALALSTAFFLDRAAGSPGPAGEPWRARVELLTPVVKAWASDCGHRVVADCMQVFGGYGYVRDYPAEQYLRDVKITSIYEGTNGIQALDFVSRKLPGQRRAVEELLAEVRATGEELADDPRLGGAAQQLLTAAKEFEAALGELAAHGRDPVPALLNAVPLLDFFGTLLGARLLLDQAVLARRRLAELAAAKGLAPGDEEGRRKLAEEHGGAGFYHDKICAALHFCHRVLPVSAAGIAALKAQDRAAMEAVF